jgi:hypothetical protein
MFCKNCGKEIGDAAKFCSNCGSNQAPVNEKIVNVPIVDRSIRQFPPQKSQMNSLSLVGLILGIVGLLYAIFLAVAYSTGIVGSPLWVCVSFLIGILCIILGAVGRKKGSKTIAVITIILGILIVALSAVDLYLGVQYSEGAGQRYLDSVHRRQEIERLLDELD